MAILSVIGSEVLELRDAQKRKISYLRVSVTDRCNYACTYCVPEGGVPMVRRDRLLNFEEICRLVRLMAAMGVVRVRLTGGEPTLRKGIAELVSELAAIEGITEIAMTSNAHLLESMAAPLAKAGLSSVNISLDTLRGDSFKTLTRRGNLARVIRGIDACVTAGMRVSTNAVALRGLNDSEFVELCEFAWERGITPRFIEHMPMSGGDAFDSRQQISSAEIRTQLAKEYHVEAIALQDDLHRGPARYWYFGSGPFGRRKVGIISAMSEHFCSTCNRLRLTATGQLHTCLAHDDALDLKSLLRAGENNATLEQSIREALSQKKTGHQFERSGSGGPAKHMISIGG